MIGTFGHAFEFRIHRPGIRGDPSQRWHRGGQASPQFGGVMTPVAPTSHQMGVAPTARVAASPADQS